VTDTRICADCQLEWPLDRFREDNPHPDVCFKCRTRGISLSVAGGKDYWKGPTERERAAHQVKEARANGLDPVPLETRGSYNAASAGTLAKIGEISKKNGAFGKKPATEGAK
jgi:hypothetical protein